MIILSILFFSGAVNPFDSFDNKDEVEQDVMNSIDFGVDINEEFLPPGKWFQSLHFSLDSLVGLWKSLYLKLYQQFVKLLWLLLFLIISDFVGFLTNDYFYGEVITKIAYIVNYI